MTDLMRSQSDEVLWYCVRTRPKVERVTAQMLRTEVGIEVFCPFVRFKRSRGRGTMWATEALFPCYLFGRFAYSEQMRHVHATAGVVKILSFGGQPAIVPETVIQAIRESVSDEELVTIPDDVQAGSEVNVVAGPYAGLRTVVTRVLPGRRRVGILLEILGMEREVEIDAEAVLTDVRRPMIQKQP